MQKRFWVLAAVALFVCAAVAAKPTYSYNKMLKKSPEKFCAMCHADKDKSYNSSGHGKFSVNCQSCHNPHGAGQAKMLKKPAEEVCFACHADMKKHYSGEGHGKVQISCTACHDPHGTPDDGAAPAPGGQKKAK